MHGGVRRSAPTVIRIPATIASILTILQNYRGAAVSYMAWTVEGGVTEAWGSDEGVRRLALREHGFVFHRDIAFTIIDAINGGHYQEHFR